MQTQLPLIIDTISTAFKSILNDDIKQLDRCILVLMACNQDITLADIVQSLQSAKLVIQFETES